MEPSSGPGKDTIRWVRGKKMENSGNSEPRERKGERVGSFLYEAAIALGLCTRRESRTCGR